MKKIIIFIIVLLIIPFLIVTFFNYEKKVTLKEIELNYISNIVVRVYRTNSDTIDNVLLEEYVVGVVAGEMPVSFEMEALKAQAVASRSYVLRKIIDNKDNSYDVKDSVSDQVYLDCDYLKNSWGDNYILYINKIREAVNDTSMEYLEYDGDIINAMYFSTSNGYTEDYNVIFGGDVPYLVSVDSFWDSDVSSVFTDSISYNLYKFYDILGIDYEKNINISDVVLSNTGRVISLKINNIYFKSRDLYSKLKLRSYDFDIIQLGDNIIINTKGYGHGVGMSQYGAYGMALDGYNYKDILLHYYTGVNIYKYNS